MSILRYIDFSLHSYCIIIYSHCVDWEGILVSGKNLLLSLSLSLSFNHIFSMSIYDPFHSSSVPISVVQPWLCKEGRREIRAWGSCAESLWTWPLFNVSSSVLKLLYSKRENKGKNRGHACPGDSILWKPSCWKGKPWAWRMPWSHIDCLRKVELEKKKLTRVLKLYSISSWNVDNKSYKNLKGKWFFMLWFWVIQSTLLQEKLLEIFIKM